MGIVVRAVFFDAVGTLIHPDPPAPVVYAAAAERFGSRCPSAEIKRRFLTAFEREEVLDRENNLRTSEEREVKRWRHIVGHALDEVADPEACFQALFAHFSRPEAWRCAAEADLVLQELVGRGYVLGMGSNYDRRLRNVVAGLPALQALQHLVISSEVGWRKPAAAFFDTLCRTAGVTAPEVLYVGDDVTNDYDGAHSAQLQAILYDPSEKAISFEGMRIRGLRSLLTMLARVR